MPHNLVYAVPPLPSSFYGMVKLNGKDLQEGTIVQALIDGEVFASTASQLHQGNSVYSLVVPGDDPGTDSVEGGVAGDTIEFRVGGNLARQTAEWQSGVNENLDLTASGGVVIATATPKPTPTATIQVFVTLTQTITQTGLSTDEQASSTPSSIVEMGVWVLKHNPWLRLRKLQQQKFLCRTMKKL